MSDDSYFIKKHKTLPTNPPINTYINRINNRLVFKVKDGYKPELQRPENMKIFGSAKKLRDKTKNVENVPILEELGVILAQCNLENNQYQQ